MEIRPAVADDYDAYARLMPELRVPDTIPSRERFARELCARAVVAVRDGVVVGYAVYEVLAEVGYVRNLVSDPAHRRAGIGVALMDDLRRRFADAGARRWCLNVKPDNVAAIALYRRCGMEVAYRSHVLRVPAEAPHAAPAPGAVVSTIAPDDDDAVETALGLLRGQLASARGKDGRTLLQLHQDGVLAGVAAFTVTIPGAFPFKVSDPALGAMLLEAVRDLAPSGSPYVQVVVEDDDALRDAVLASGAHVVLEILHMRGTL